MPSTETRGRGGTTRRSAADPSRPSPIDALADEIRKYAPDLGPALRAQVAAHQQSLTAIRPLVEWTRSVTGRLE